jgi:hypothetical protein
MGAEAAGVLAQVIDTIRRHISIVAKGDKMRKRLSGYFFVLFVFVVIIVIWFSISKYKKTSYKDDILDSIQTVRGQLKIDNHETIYLTNKLKADLCVICPPYLDIGILDRGLNSKIGVKAKQKIDRISNDGEENWSLILIKNKKLIFYCFLPYTQVVNPDLDNMLIAKIADDKIGLHVVKVKSERNLQVIDLE